ncbi:cohesin domain-containing protein [Paenibacillus sp. E194]|uniref:cohesin domain-containing protein n=1 Tax=Paenibacillus sp. E194 TaxID=1458845 RepID=UPI001E4C5832|nr:cohesin domain-containing protein [Paenibacillus sp. E194]
MKKYLAALAFLLILLMVPQKGFAAFDSDFSGGLLDKNIFVLKGSTPENSINTRSNGLTDKNINTGLRFSAYGGNADRAILESAFKEPATVSAIKLFGYNNKNKNISASVGFLNKDGEYIQVNGENFVKISLEQDGSLIEIPRTSGIYRVIIINDSKEAVSISEINLYDYGVRPLELSANAESTSVSLKWNSVAGSLGYNVERSTTTGGPYEKIASVVETTYRDLNVVYGKTYFYVITSVNDKGEGQKSNEASATPYPSEETSEVTIDIESAKDKVFLNETFTVQAVLNNATNIFAEDFNVKYDKTRFQLVKVEAADHMGLFHNGTVAEDTVRLITASLGKNYGINEKGTLVHFTFKAIGLGKGKIDVTKGKIADNGTTETTLTDVNFGKKEIEVIGGDFTNFTLKHLGFLGYNYTENKNKLTDELKNLLGSAGNVADVDLVQLTNAILANPNYDFNK